MYEDIGRYAKAREQYEKIATLPIADAMDPYYQRQAAEQLIEIRDKKDKT